MASKAYEIAFKLGAKMDKSYGNVFQMAEEIAERTVGRLVRTAAAIGSAVLSVDKIKESVDKAISFESAMADVAKVVDGLKDPVGNATEAYHKMSREILDMTTRLPMTGEELAKITASAGQAGIASRDLTLFTETAAKMGVAFDVTAEQAGDWMAVWRTSFKMSQPEVTKLADQINYLSNTSSENAVKLSGVVSRIGSLAEVSGLSAAEVAAMAASMTGVTEEISATGIKNLMKAMTLGDAAKKSQTTVLKKLGFSATDLAKRMQTDAKGAILDLLKAIQKLPEAERSAALTQYFGSESVQAIAPLLNNLENLEDQFKKVADASLYAGSMENEFASRAATTENKIQLAQNAIDKFQISIGNLMLPLVGKGADMFSDNINKLTEKLPAYADKAASQLGKTWKTVEPMLTWVKKNPMTIAKFIIAIGSAITAYKVADGIKGIVKSLSLVLTINPVLLMLAALAGAIAFVAVSVAETNRKLKQENLSQHFGNISMSMGELDDVAKRIVRTNNLDKLADAINAFSDMGQFEQSISEAVDRLNKYSWKVSIGLTLSEDEVENYKQSITDFISDTQELLLQKQYALNLSMNVLTSDNDFGQSIRTSVDSFYQNNYDELVSLGTQLQKAVNDSFEDGFLDIDEQKAITELQKKIATITDTLAKSQFEAKLEVMGMAFDGTALTGESFKMLQGKINEEVLATQEKYQEALTLNIANAKVMLDQGEIKLDEYNKWIDEFKHNYLANVGEIELKAAGFQYDTILKAYDKELKAVIPEFQELLSDNLNGLMSDYNENGVWGALLLDYMDGVLSYDGLDKATKANLKDLFNYMEPLLAEANKLPALYEEMGKTIPEALSKGILDMSTLGALVGNEGSIYTILGSAFSENNGEYANVLDKLEKQGAYIPEKLMEGVKLQYPLIEDGASDMVSCFFRKAESELAAGLQVAMPIRIMTVNDSAFSRYPVSNLRVPKYARGSDYTADTFIAGERGAELVTGARGRKVFTAAETGSIFDNFMKLTGLLTDKVSGSMSNLLNPSGTPDRMGAIKAVQTHSVKNETSIPITLHNKVEIVGTNKSDSELKQLLFEVFNDIGSDLKSIVEDAVEEIEYRRLRLANG